MHGTSGAIANLRAFAIALVVCFHSVLAYLGSQPNTQPPFEAPPYIWRAFPILDHEKWFGFDLFCALIYVFLMPLMFFISGLFVLPSIERKGVSAFVRGRFLRIGLPFALGALILMPLAHYPVFRLTAANASWQAYLAALTALPFWPIGPHWFLWHILALDILAAAAVGLGLTPVARLKKASLNAAEAPERTVMAFAGVAVVAYLPLASYFKPWDWSQFGPFSMQTAQVLLFVAYFCAGVATGASDLDRGLLSAEGCLSRRWRLWLVLAPSAFFAWLAVTALTVENAPWIVLERLSSVLFALASVAACAAILAVFLRFAAHTASLTAKLSRDSYGIYYTHYFFVTWLQFFMLGIAIPAVAKGTLVFAATFLLSWAAAAGFEGAKRSFWASYRPAPGGMLPFEEAIIPIQECREDKVTT
jgi:hypothetical protein